MPQSSRRGSDTKSKIKTCFTYLLFAGVMTLFAILLASFWSKHIETIKVGSIIVDATEFTEEHRVSRSSEPMKFWWEFVSDSLGLTLGSGVWLLITSVGILFLYGDLRNLFTGSRVAGIPDAELEQRAELLAKKLFNQGTDDHPQGEKPTTAALPAQNPTPRNQTQQSGPTNGEPKPQGLLARNTYIIRERAAVTFLQGVTFDILDSQTGETIGFAKKQWYSHSLLTISAKKGGAPILSIRCSFKLLNFFFPTEVHVTGRDGQLFGSFKRNSTLGGFGKGEDLEAFDAGGRRVGELLEFLRRFRMNDRVIGTFDMQSTRRWKESVMGLDSTLLEVSEDARPSQSERAMLLAALFSKWMLNGALNNKLPMFTSE